MSATPSFALIFVVLTCLAGFVALLGLLIYNKPTRLLGLSLLGMTVFGVPALLLTARVAMTRTTERPMDPGSTSVETERVWRRLTEPKIELDDAPSAHTATTAADAPRRTGPQPDWVRRPPKRVGGVYRAVIESGPYATLDECYTDTKRQLIERAEWYVLNEEAGPYEPVPLVREHTNLLGARLSELRERLVRDEYVEIVESSIQDMTRLYTLVEIAPADGEWLVELRREKQREDNFWGLGLLAGGVLSLVGLAFGALKFDEVTRGYYTRSLLLTVPAAIIGIVLLGLWMA